MKLLITILCLMTGCANVYKVDEKGVCTLNGKVTKLPEYLSTQTYNKRKKGLSYIGGQHLNSLWTLNPFAPGTAFCRYNEWK